MAQKTNPVEAVPDHEFDLVLRLLDRQVADPDGGLICKIDDLEFGETADGTYVVSALLSGSLALGPRLPGRLGRWVMAVARRMSTDPDPAPERIPFERVTELGSAIVIDRRREDVGVSPLEDWVREHIIEPIPGSSHEGE
jgi:sporulation protein YlmC with PRC-barrel domain